MTPVYLSGVGLASSLGANLAEALARLPQTGRPETSIAPQRRSVRGLPQTFPYHAIASRGSGWNMRCAQLVRAVAAEAGYRTANSGPASVNTALYLASASTYVGAMEADEHVFNGLNDFSAAVADMLEWQGPVIHINSACTSSLNALLEAKSAVERGAIDEALILGLELENQLSLAGFAGLQLLSCTEARPFDTRRDGQILGEAVAALRLSKTPGRWRLAGGAHVIDSAQVSGASATAYQAMLTQTLEQAQWKAAEVDGVKVQASGSVINDAVEAEALCDFFSPVPALVSLKPHIGHTLGASGAAEIALLLSLLAHGKWPTPPCQHQAGNTGLKVSLAARPPENISKLLACILGFGGSHACVAIESVSEFE